MAVTAILERFEGLGLRTLLLAIPVLAIFYGISVIIYNVFFHPLSSIPGPWTYAATRIPHMHNLMLGILPFDTARLHRKYGDVVRIAPDELSFQNADAWKDIYGHRPGLPEMVKDRRFYPQSFEEVHSIFQSNDADHTRVRKLISTGFSDGALRAQEPLMMIYINMLIVKLRERAAKGEVVDMCGWLNWMSFDLIGDLAFGEPFDCLKDSDYHPWVAMIFAHVKTSAYSNVIARIPGGTRLMMALMPKSLAIQRQNHFDLTKNKVLKRLAKEGERPDLLGYILKQNERGKGMSTPEIIVNSGDFILAGSETTATLLSGALYYLLRNPSTLARLSEEVRTTFAAEDEITLAKSTVLPYTSAVINEALRLYPPVPSGLPRIVPGKGEVISGVWVAGQTAVSVAPMAASRDPNNFRDPDAFHPERYMNESEYVEDKKHASQPFSFGPRNCIGKNLAYAEMRITLARLVWNFDIELDPRSSNWTNQLCFLLWQKEPLWLKLKNREKV